MYVMNMERERGEREAEKVCNHYILSMCYEYGERKRRERSREGL